MPAASQITYKQAVVATFIEGWLFLILSVTGVRGHVIRLVPKAVMSATAGGIGLFLTFIGLQSSNGLGVVTADQSTLVTLGAARLRLVRGLPVGCVYVCVWARRPCTILARPPRACCAGGCPLDERASLYAISPDAVSWAHGGVLGLAARAASSPWCTTPDFAGASLLGAWMLQVPLVCQCQLYNGTAIPTAASPRLGPASATYVCSECARTLGPR